jgi:hypothetical protein
MMPKGSKTELELIRNPYNFRLVRERVILSKPRIFIEKTRVFEVLGMPHISKINEKSSRKQR